MSYKIINHAPKKLSGYSLMELLIAMALSVFLIGAAVVILTRNSNSYQLNIDHVQVQDNARFALDAVVNDLRMAGYFGCGKKIVNNLNLANLTGQINGHILDTTYAIDGLEQDTGVWSAQNINANLLMVDTNVTIKPGTDGIVVRKLWGKGVPIRANMVAGADNVLVKNAGFGANSIAAIYDCQTTNIFQATSVANDQIGHMSGSSFKPGNLFDGFMDGASNEDLPYQQTQIYLATVPTDSDPNGIRAKTFVSRFDAFRYFVSEPTGGEPGLWRQYFNVVQSKVVEEELVEGVENMQILYLVEPPNANPPTYVKANQVAQAAGTGVDGWRYVTAIKLTLLIRSERELGTYINKQKYDIYSTPDDASDDFDPVDDRRRRYLVSTTILMRNRQFDPGSLTSS